MNLDIQHFKDLLVKEKEILEKDLSSIGRKIDPSGVVWESVSNQEDNTADREEVASSIESFENNEGAISILETQLHEVNHALEKIEKGTYGICEVSGEEIEIDRLEANPSARTSKKHL
ncbi:MAG: TraR/DksA C4-type zinc finger protein [Candidatus Pacebacteria bacterium]|nr:TraR/DksA C4-type zinc finger protein [Candidatus Paceibacterota bacterium]